MEVHVRENIKQISFLQRGTWAFSGTEKYLEIKLKKWALSRAVVATERFLDNIRLIF